MVAIVLFVSVVSFLGQADASVKCFQCVHKPHPQDCQTITTCTSHEICYVEQFVTSGGQVLYNSGCLSKARCTIGGKRAVPYDKHYFQRLQKENYLANEKEEGLDKRQNPVSVTDIATCMQCCDGNFCNVEGCGTTVGCKEDGYIYDPLTKLCLKFYESPRLNWTESQQHCNSTKGKLVIITDDQKIRDVLNFYKHSGYTSPLWVGATDFGNVHVFTFTDGSKLTVDPAEGQDLRNANCLYVTGGSYKGFGPCSDKHGFICERSSAIRA